jgi:hypothetical protein
MLEQVVEGGGDTEDKAEATERRGGDFPSESDGHAGGGYENCGRAHKRRLPWSAHETEAE